MNATRCSLATVFFLGLLVPFPTDVHAQFEGVVETSNLTTNELGELREFVMTMWIKDGMVKVTYSSIGDSHGTTLVYRNDRRETWVFNDETKSYLLIPHDSLAQSPGAQGVTPKNDPHTVKRTHNKKTVLGYSAEQFIVRQGEQLTEVWGTKSLPHLARAISAAFGPSEGASGWAQDLMNMGLFTLVSTTKLHGKVVESQTVTRIERRKMPQELFEIPSGYRRETAQEMIRRLGQGSKP